MARGQELKEVKEVKARADAQAQRYQQRIDEQRKRLDRLSSILTECRAICTCEAFDKALEGWKEYPDE